MTKSKFRFAGEYFVSLKGYKIPLKSSAHVDIKNRQPLPPGTEDESTAYIPPLVKRPIEPSLEATSPKSPQIVPSSHTSKQFVETEASPSKPIQPKRSSLFSNFMNIFCNLRQNGR